MEKLKQLEQNIIQWADDRGFFGEGGATLFGQYLKLREEFGELSGNLAKGRCMKDDIGDLAVVAIIMNRLNGGGDITLSNDILSYSNTEGKLNFLNIEATDAYLLIDSKINNLSDAIYDEDFTDFSEEITSGFALLMYFAKVNGYNFTECIEHAYNEIKDRKGKWINNVFVKESDLTGE